MSPLALTMAPLAAELLNLLSYRAERIADAEAPPDAEELASLNGEIRRYFDALPRKVDGTAAVLRHMKFTRQQIAAEQKRLAGVDSGIEREEKELKEYILGVLEQQPEPQKGCKKLEGTHSTLMLKGNGGVEPLVISQPELIPDEFTVVEVRLPLLLWADVVHACPPDVLEQLTKLPPEKRTPSNALVREALIQPCEPCDGTGEILVPTGVDVCPSCRGTRRASVPGAHLDPRGFHIEVK